MLVRVCFLVIFLLCLGSLACESGRVDSASEQNNLMIEADTLDPSVSKTTKMEPGSLTCDLDPRQQIWLDYSPEMDRYFFRRAVMHILPYEQDYCFQTEWMAEVKHCVFSSGDARFFWCEEREASLLTLVNSALKTETVLPFGNQRKLHRRTVWDLNLSRQIEPGIFELQETIELGGIEDCWASAENRFSDFLRPCND